MRAWSMTSNLETQILILLCIFVELQFEKRRGSLTISLFKLQFKKKSKQPNWSIYIWFLVTNSLHSKPSINLNLNNITSDALEIQPNFVMFYYSLWLFFNWTSGFMKDRNMSKIHHRLLLEHVDSIMAWICCYTWTWSNEGQELQRYR